MNWKHSINTLATVSCLAIAGSACSGAMDDSGDEGASDGSYEIVEPGKADNYYSNVATEYEFEGTIDVQMTDEEYEDDAERNRKVSQRTSAAALYLTTYLTDKIRGVDSDNSGEIEDDEVLFENMEYGGFQAMVRNYSVETEDLTEVGENTYAVDYTVDAAGPQNLLRRLAGEGHGELTGEGTVAMSFEMPAGATTDPDDVERGEIRDFDPSEYDGELEEVRLEGGPHSDISNAYPHFDDFVEDGVYDITLYYGHDYNESRSDLQGAEDAFAKLERKGFEAPVSSFDDLGAESGPFVREIGFPGEETPDTVRVEVRIFHSEMFDGRRDFQHDQAIDELTSRDVFFYNGHAGPYYGLYIDPDHDAQVEYREIAEMDFPDKQQLFIAQGCQTYSQYADMMYANPAKSEENLDVITTVNYSYGRGTLELFDNLVKLNDGTHEPVAFYDIVKGLNSDWVNRTREVFYGVMGIDGNPQIHPQANVDAIGASCETDADCGAANAHHCIQNECAADALSEASCPEGTEFGYLGQGDTLEGGVCHR